MATDLASRLRARLGLAPPEPVPFARVDRHDRGDHIRERITYQGREGDEIPAFLLLPRDRPPAGGVVVFHQHNGEFHLGKSEVAGDVGSPYQAFGPALARGGLAVLAPDALTFEERRIRAQGTEPGHFDWVEHYNALSYRLLAGDTLMRKGLDDAQRALSVLQNVLQQETGRDVHRVGIAGHSYGGYTALYHAAVDPRPQCVVISGALCTVATRQREHTGITLFETVPELARDFPTPDVLAAIGARPILVVSGSEDKYSRDADDIVTQVGGDAITHLRTDRAHALDQERFDAIVAWLVGQFEI